MKIFYAIQATGNGHISRAIELLPYLQQYGSVDIFLSGDNSGLLLNAPVAFRSKGVSLHYNKQGGLDYWKLIRGFNPFHLQKEIRELPVEKYDLVLNDFEFITAAACAYKKIPSIHFGHQASYQSEKSPRPEKRDWLGELILKKYAKASHHVGLHFQRYDDFIFTPVIRKEILNAEPKDNDFITVYLQSYSSNFLYDHLSEMKGHRFQIFLREIIRKYTIGNITFLPIDRDLFNQSLVCCSGIITNGGFETPAEAMHLGKKLMIIPVNGQYEQYCNAAALKLMNITTHERIGYGFKNDFEEWIYGTKAMRVEYTNCIPTLLDYLFSLQNKISYQNIPVV